MEANRRAKSGGKGGIFVIIAVLAVVLLQPGGEANGRTITVRADGSGDYPTIQAAIDDANEGDEVVLEPGTYTGDGNRDIDFLGKAITVRSTEPNNPEVVAGTVIDCQGSEWNRHRGFYFHNGEDNNSILAGLVIRNGHAPTEESGGVYSSSAGGGILCNSSSPTIVLCRIEGNAAGYHTWDSYGGGSGGGISCRESSATISQCTVRGNTAYGDFAGGGGISCGQGALNVRECTISNNISRAYASAIYGGHGGYSYGGGISCGYESMARIEGCQILENSAIGGQGSGGSGAPPWPPWPVSVDISEELSSTYGASNGGNGGTGGSAMGGGIYCTPKSKAVIKGCRIADNYATGGRGGSGGRGANGMPDGEDGGDGGNGGHGGPARGGGICCYQETECRISNCVITGNSVAAGAGGYGGKGGDGGDGSLGGNVRRDGGDGGDGGDAGGAGSAGGGGIWYDCSSEQAIKNCTIADNTVVGNTGGEGGSGGAGGAGTAGGSNGSWGAWGDDGSDSSSYGGGISGNASIIHCILRGDGADYGSEVAALKVGEYDCYVGIWNCDVKGLQSATYEANECMIEWGEGNIDVEAWLTRDGHFLAGSPCINAGDPNYIVSPNETDVDGEARVYDGIIDIGADEFIDTDGDGLPDWYEEEYFGEATAGDPEDDPDGDGLDNLAEYERSRNPLRHPFYYVNAADGNDLWDGLAAAWDGTHGPKATIQAGIDTADASEGTVVVAEGTYKGQGNRDLDFKGKAITVRSTDPEDGAVVAATVIDCNASHSELHRGFKFHSGEEPDSVVAGITIMNGFAPEEQIDVAGLPSEAYIGGGIFCDGSSPTISKCVIRANGGGLGGGIFCVESNAKIEDCVIEENMAYADGSGIGFFNSDLTIKDCTVSNNEGGSGIACWSESSPNIVGCTINDNNSAGIWCDIDAEPNIDGCVISGNEEGGVVDCRGIIRNCIISGNSAKYGAGLRRCYCPVTDCIITENSAEEDGGGLYECSGPIANCVISNNRAEDGGGVANCGGTITNCLIVQNRAEGAGYYEGRGGGLYMYDGAVVNCTIVGNRAGQAGGGLGYCSGSVTNCIVWDNRPDQFYESGLVTYSNVEGGWEGEGNIDLEPEFALEGDYHIMPGSACIDAGTNDPCGGLAGTDLEGVARPLDGDGDGNALCDMGAYEFDPNRPKIVVSSDNFYFPQDWPEHEAQTLLIRNSGGQRLNWEVVEDCNWLQVVPDSGATNGEIVQLSLIVDANGLAPGVYSYTIILQDANDPDVQVSITVTLPVGWVLQVPSAEYPTIQSAIDAASDYDVVVVADGNYTGEGDKNLDFGGKTITVKSENGPDNCLIVCETSDSGFSSHSANEGDSVVNGFTITGGVYGISSWYSRLTVKNCIIKGSREAGVRCLEGDLEVSNCKLSGTGEDGIVCARRGGKGPFVVEIENSVVSSNSGHSLISCGQTTIATIENCTVSGNYSDSGMSGAISCGGETSIINCVISDNTSIGIWCAGYTNITKCRIIGNRTDVFLERGGGIYFDGRRLTIGDCEVSENSAWRGGGGIYCKNGVVTILNSRIRENISRTEYGGGISFEDDWNGELALINCVVSGNFSDSGGGIYCNSDFGLTVENCTVGGNIALRHGGGILCGGGDVGIINSILWGNESPYGPQMQVSGYSETSVSYSDVQGGVNDIHIGAGVNVDWGAGNIDADPRFALNGDCHLMWDSPCIDAGTNNPTGGLPSGDAEGVARRLDGDGDGNSVADMGAYEFSLEDSTIAVSSRMFWFVQDWPEREPQTLYVRNCGGEELNWEVVEDCNWLEVTPTNGVSLDEIDEVTITVDPNGLAPGLYRYTLRVEDEYASNSPVDVAVAMPVGEVLWVPSGEFGTIQEAIDAANDYDVVVVQDGIYSGEGNRALELHGKAITVRSVNGPNECIIDCNDADHGLNLRRNEGWSSVIDGFTIMDANVGIRCYPSSPLIRNCIVTGSYHSGVQCRSSVVRIENSTIMGSKGDAESAGIRCLRSSPRITGCTISSNNGAGIYDEGDSWVVVSGCRVCDNGGGGICSEGGLVIDGSTISGNMAEVMGGGIRSRSTRMRGCTITGNSAPYFGGIISDGRLVTIENCVISDNTAYDAFGGVFFGNPYNKGHVMTNCLIAGNKSLGYGIGGLGCMGGTISNCTIVGNWALNLGGGAACEQGDVNILNCIIWGNESPVGSEIYLRNEGFVFVSYSDVEGGEGSVYVEPNSVLEWGFGNIDMEPEFVEAGYWDANGTAGDVNDDFWVEGDYHLSEGSPCIDSGDPNYLAWPGETDLDGKARVADGDGDGVAVVDMGAYEAEPPAIEVEVKFTPRTLNCESEGRWVKAHIILPEGYWPEDIDVNTPAVIEPTGAESEYIKVFDKGRGRFGVEIGFEREAFCAMEPEGEDGYLDVKVTGWLLTGQRFEGTDTIKIIKRHWRHRHEKRFREKPAKRMIGDRYEARAGRSQTTREDEAVVRSKERVRPGGFIR